MTSSIVKSIAQQLGNLLVDEAVSLYKVKDKIESLKKELEFMVGFLQYADSQPRQEEVVCLWASEVQDLAYDAEDIVERYLYDVSHHRRDGFQNTVKWVSRILSTWDPYTLHNLGSDIDALRNKLSELTSRLERYDIKTIMSTSAMEYNTTIKEERRTNSHTEEDAVVVGLDDDIQQVVDRLVKTDVKVVCIGGIGGLGKTTLAKKVFQHKDIKDHFNNNCAWVYLSKEFERWDVCQLILLELVKGEKGKKRIKEQLHKVQLDGELHKILQERRCLIIVDDIWTEKAWDIILESGLKTVWSTASSSKILFTTRNQGLLQYVSAHGYPHLLNFLSLEQSWQLLKMKALTEHGRTGDDDQVKHEGEMEILGKEMLKHCGGLPIAIVALGGILLRKKRIQDWKRMKDNLSTYLISGVNEGARYDNLTFKVLDLSYYDLPFHLKPCFLCLGIFPEDYTISTHRLYHLWEAEGFLVGGSYDNGEEYLEELVQRSMVQVGERWSSGGIKTCRVHNVMREMCLRKCRAVGFLNYIECNESDSLSTRPAFSIDMKKLRRCGLNDEKGDFVDRLFEHGEEVAIGVRSLLVFRSTRRLQKVWKCCPQLRVVDLQGMMSFVGSIDGVGDLSHLRYLNLKNSGVEVLPPCLYNLKYLETLDLRSRGYRWKGVKLENKFVKMKKLKHLYLPFLFEVEGGEKLKFPKDGLQIESLKNFDLDRCEATQLIRMTKLRVFSIRKYYIFEKGEELKRVLMAPVMKEEGQLINSLRLEIRASVILEEPGILSSAAQHPFFKEIIIRGNDQNSSGNISIIGVAFPERLTSVKLSGCEVGEGEVLALEKLSHLKFLSLYGGIGNKLSFSPSGFPQLTELGIMSQDELEEWEIGEGALPNLHRLTLSLCGRLKKVNNFPNSLTDVDFHVYEIRGGGCLLLGLKKLPRLKSLTVLTLLNKLRRWIFTPPYYPELTRLTLQIQDRVAEYVLGDDDFTPIQRSELTSFTFYPGSFPNLVELQIQWQSTLEVEDGALPNLQHLELHGCRKLSNIPISLTHVKLVKCEIGEAGGGVSLLAFQNLPRLQQLTLHRPIIQGEGNQMSFCAASFPQLRELEISSAEKLKELEIEDGALPNLQRLKVLGCSKLKKFLHKLPDLQLLRVDLGG